ncbi:unnamed protein product [Rotaria socialis]|uniref:Uncharacterized protein n=2 Tax=Rotaria socialis TaxID=392032 RepID=A0A820UZU1_9BILA|nr:unnamed protein product [Rotaria socialis]
MTDYALFIVTILNDQTEEDKVKQTTEMSSSLCEKLKSYFSENTDIKPVWMPSTDQKTYQVTFHAEFGVKSDRILLDLNQRDIGIKHGSRVCVVPTTVFMETYDHVPNNTSNIDVTSVKSTVNTDDDFHSVLFEDSAPKSKVRKHIDTSKFKKSVRARLMVHQVVASIRAATQLSFDFIVLLSLASMLAGFGLLENSSVIIVASMLVSPLMNPIMGIVFGLSVREHSLWQRGIRNELIGLALCILWGFLIGLCTTHVETRWGSSTSFPTSEMKSRGDLKRLWVGVLIALPSGAGVALSVLGGNAGSLVGVAISGESIFPQRIISLQCSSLASLLPPAVNCGLLLAYALLSHAISNVATSHMDNNSSAQTSELFFSFQNRLRPNDPIINCSRFINNDYLPYYSCYMPNEAAILGGCSLLLTIVNILCIIIMALIILRIKEVLPLHQESKEIVKFFHHDVKVARDYNKSITVKEPSRSKNFGSPKLRVIVLSKSITKHWKELIPSSKGRVSPTACSSNATFYPDNSADLSRLQTYAEDFDLDVFSIEDRELTTSESKEKVICLANNILDMYEEKPSTFVDLSRLQPYGEQTSARKEHISFYKHLIELLPPKWYEVFDRERCRRINTESTASRERSNSFSEQSLNEQHEPVGFNRPQKIKSEPRHNLHITSTP